MEGEMVGTGELSTFDLFYLRESHSRLASLAIERIVGLEISRLSTHD
jgi:hypothetical protein